MNRKSVREFRETDPGSFTTPECWDIEIPITKSVGEPAKLLAQNFVNAILKNEALICPVADGDKGLEIGNAMLLAGLTRKPVDLPIDGDQFDGFLKELTQKYGGHKTLGTTQGSPDAQMSSSFGQRA
jgi:hypothetical protein